ncbi:MAG: cell wall hydrolase [Pseudomonadota bacterium]
MLRPLLLTLLVLAACSSVPEDTSSRAAVDPSEFECMREAIYFEAHARHTEGQHAVADVIKNRARDPRFPDTICGVISDGCQFSYRCDGIAETFPDAIKYESATLIAREALENPEEDITSGALFFHAVRMAPGWFASLIRTGSFGGNIFYRG